MIPLAIPAALRAVPWRLVLWAGVVAAIGLAGWRVGTWKRAYDELPAAQEALQREIECGEGSACLERSLAAQAQAGAASAVVIRGYEDEIEKLRNRPVPVRAVRLCPPAGAGDVRHANPAGRADAGTTAGGEFSGAAGSNPDIGPALYQLARDADEIVAQCRGLQNWNRALAAPAKGAE